MISGIRWVSELIEIAGGEDIFPEFRECALGKDRIIAGSPEECVAEFRRWSDAVGSDYFLLRLRHAHSGGPPHADIMKTIERFGRDVIPHLGD